MPPDRRFVPIFVLPPKFSNKCLSVCSQIRIPRMHCCTPGQMCLRCWQVCCAGTTRRAAHMCAGLWGDAGSASQVSRGKSRKEGCEDTSRVINEGRERGAEERKDAEGRRRLQEG